jgi:hypothetical protein
MVTAIAPPTLLRREDGDRLKQDVNIQPERSVLNVATINSCEPVKCLSQLGMPAAFGSAVDAPSIFASSSPSALSASYDLCTATFIAE